MKATASLERIIHSRQALFSLGIGGLVLAAAAVALAGAWIFQFRSAADYPGSLIISDHVLTAFIPHPVLRRDTSYRTADDFPTVYNFYSTSFDMGSERRAQSGCIHLDSTRSFVLVRHDISVTVCDTRNGRMVFVNRAVALAP